MDEYLFFQKNKNYLKDNSSLLSPRIFESHRTSQTDLDNKSSITSLRTSQGAGKITFLNQPIQSNFMPSPKPNPAPKFDNRGKPQFPPQVELNEETMQDCFRDLSKNYIDQYTASGFPPKVCTLIMKDLINNTQKLKCRILDIGCGKGHVGEELKYDGFPRIYGMDCSKNLLEMAQQKKCYEKLVKTVFGKDEIDPALEGKFDVLISATMINNDGWDKNAFDSMLKYVKMGGFIIFATKLDLNGDNQYANEIDTLNNEMHWKFVTDHTFYRYDKLCGGKGKFSNKLVKIVAYQRTDHEEYLIREKDRLEEEAIMAQQQKEELERQLRLKDQKLNANQNDRKNRQKRLDAEARAEQDAELNAQQAEQQSIEEEELAAQRVADRKKMMMKKLKSFIENAMWIKLKALKKQEEDKLEMRRVEAEEKRKEAVMKRKQAMVIKKPWDSDEEADSMQDRSPAFRSAVKSKGLGQSHAA